MNENTDYGQMELQDLEKQIEFLHTLCQELDPYAPLEEKTKESLKKLKIDPDNKDPFALTNQLIVRMENALEELQSRQ